MPETVYLVGAILLSLMVSSCSQTVASKPAAAGQVENGAAPPSVTSFFGSDYTLLQPGSEGQAAMVYINPNVQWSKYDKVMLEPVEFWDSANSRVSPSDQHMLIGYFYNQLKQDLEQHFTLVDQGGPGVLVPQVALTNASAATPGLRSVSVAIPQARILNMAQSLATGSYAFVGSAQGQMKITDSQTGQLLAGAIDKRAGGVALSSAAQWRWGDAENAMNYWAQKISDRLFQLCSGSIAAATSTYAAVSARCANWLHDRREFFPSPGPSTLLPHAGETQGDLAKLWTRREIAPRRSFASLSMTKRFYGLGERE
jgi:hypothetical protein